MDELLSIIADPKTDKEILIQAIQNLGLATEAAQFWVDIANSDEYSQDHRRWAVFMLFQRHVSPGITLAELAEIMNNPRWLADSDVSVVTCLAGKIPVQFTLEDSIFVLSVFPDLPDERYDHWAIYLRVSGKVAPEDLIRILRGDVVSEKVSSATVLEFALVPSVG